MRVCVGEEEEERRRRERGYRIYMYVDAVNIKMRKGIPVYNYAVHDSTHDYDLKCKGGEEEDPDREELLHKGGLGGGGGGGGWNGGEGEGGLDGSSSGGCFHMDPMCTH